MWRVQRVQRESRRADILPGAKTELPHNIKVEINDTITKGDVLSNVGGIPCESKDGIHLHVAVRVNGSYVDPLSVISNNE